VPITLAEESNGLAARDPPAYWEDWVSASKDMGWMHDTLGISGAIPVYSQVHQNDLTFAMLSSTENWSCPSV